MITPRKLSSLKESTRNRKILRILEEAEITIVQGNNPHIPYLLEVIQLLPKELSLENPTTQLEIHSFATPTGRVAWRRAINTLRHSLSTALGATPGDWDFIHSPHNGVGDRITYPATLYLDDIRSPFNVGAIFRTAEAFGVSEILHSSGTAAIDHQRTHRTARGTTQLIPHRPSTPEKLLALSKSTPIFAMETGGTSLFDFTFPQRGLMIIGSEELGVAPELLEIAQNSGGVVSIPMAGVKGSLNVSAAYAIVMAQWFQQLHIES